MARINLGREQGPRPSGSAQFGGVSAAGYGAVMGGMDRVARANDSVARGAMYVSDTLAGIFNDQAETRNRQEFLEGQTALFELTNSANEKIQKDIDEGKFDNAEGLQKFGEAVRNSHREVERQFNEWSRNNVTQIDTRNALNEHAKLDFKRNFAHLSGAFIAHDRKRRWDMYQKGITDAIEDQNESNLKAHHNAYFGDGSKENPYRTSKEIRERALKEEHNRFDKKTLEIRFSQADQIVEPGGQSAMYAAILTDLENGKYKGLYLSESAKLVSNIKKVLNTHESKSEIDSCRAALAKDLGRISQEKLAEWENQALSEIDEKKHLSSDEKKYFKEKISAKRKNLEAKFIKNGQTEHKNSTLSLLDSAVRSGNGDVDLSLDFVHGAELEKKRSEIDTNEGAFFGIGKNAQDYDRKFRNLIREIDKYTPGNDRDGMCLRGLLFRTQGFLREHRVMLLNALNNKAKGIVPDKWSSENLYIFERQIDELFEWYDVNPEMEDEKIQMGENSKAAAFYQFRNSIVEDVKKLGLTPFEAQEYLQKHPVYKRLKDRQAYADAVDFLGGMAMWNVSDISDSNGGADHAYGLPFPGSLLNISDWRGRRYFGM